MPISNAFFIIKALYIPLAGCKQRPWWSVGPFPSLSGERWQSGLWWMECFCLNRWDSHSLEIGATIPLLPSPAACTLPGAQTMHWVQLHISQLWPTPVCSLSRPDLKEKKIPTLKFCLKSDLSPALPAGQRLTSFASQPWLTLTTHSLTLPNSPFLSFSFRS